MTKPIYGIPQNRFLKCKIIVSAPAPADEYSEVMETEEEYNEVVVDGFIDISMIMSCWNRFDSENQTQKKNECVIIMKTGDHYMIEASTKEVYDVIQRYEQTYFRTT